MRTYGTLVLWSNRCAFTWDCFFGIVLTMYHKCSLLRSNGNHGPSHQEVQGLSCIAGPSVQTNTNNKNVLVDEFLKHDQMPFAVWWGTQCTS